MPPKDLPTPPPVITDGRRQYEIKKELGRGGFAPVYLADEQGITSAKAVAVKVTRTEIPDERMKAKFLMELQIHSKLHHKHIVQFWRAFTDGSLTYIVLEVCPAGTMKDLLNLRGTLSTPEIRRYVIQIASALSYLHSRCVIHRDIKLANILLDSDCNPKLTDFGLSAPLLTNKEGAEIRRITLCGTPNYIAPETLNRQEGHDRRADIWSLGVIIYLLYTRAMPFSDPKKTKTQAEIFANVKGLEYSWPTKSKSRVPAAAEELVSLILTDAAERITLDQLVQHKFFAKGIPNQVSSDKEIPYWLARDTGEIATRYSFMEIPLQSMLKESGFVSNSESPLPQGSIFHEFIREEKEMRGPSLPLATIYEPRSAERVVSSRASKPQPTLLTETMFAREDETDDRIRVSAASIAAAPLRSLLAQLDVYILSKTTAYSWPTQKSTLPCRIVQWIDYIRKYGMGLVLSNGTIMTMFSTTKPSAAVSITNVVSHHVSGEGRLQYVPKDCRIEFLERNSTGYSIRRRTEGGEYYQVSEDGKLDEEGDECRVVRCSKVRTWSRFAGYMTSRLSDNARLQLSEANDDDGSIIPLVYQRWGNVHVWVWSNMSTQWEFSDHTKIQVSADANMLQFWNDAESWMLPTRQVFEATEALNCGIWKASQDFDILGKLKFIRTVLKVWSEEKSVGVRGQQKLLYNAKDDEKLEWTAAIL